MARHFRGSGVGLRFIEYMDVGATNGWRMEQVVPGGEALARLQGEFALVPLASVAQGETAERWGYASADGRHDPAQGEVGFINSVTQPFCGACNRARLSTEGRLYLCLFAGAGYDLRAPLRAGVDDEALTETIAAIWRARADRYSELRTSLGAAPVTAAAHRVEMSYIGG
jgi:cyclic pyranopterin phosphate synthase